MINILRSCNAHYVIDVIESGRVITIIYINPTKSSLHQASGMS